MNSTQYQVAIEMGFVPDRVRRALTKQRFECAGDLIDYLEDKVSDEEEEEGEEKADKKAAGEVKEGNTIQGAVAEVATAAIRELSLREETEIYYRQSVCLRCRERKRAIVCLPSFHFTLCSLCSHLARRCPLPDCQQPIDETILSYMV